MTLYKILNLSGTEFGGERPEYLYMKKREVQKGYDIYGARIYLIPLDKVSEVFAGKSIEQIDAKDIDADTFEGFDFIKTISKEILVDGDFGSDERFLVIEADGLAIHMEVANEDEYMRGFDEVIALDDGNGYLHEPKTIGLIEDEIEVEFLDEPIDDETTYWLNENYFKESFGVTVADWELISVDGEKKILAWEEGTHETAKRYMQILDL